MGGNVGMREMVIEDKQGKKRGWGRWRFDARALISKWEAENRGKQKKKRTDFEDKPLHVCVGAA